MIRSKLPPHELLMSGLIDVSPFLYVSDNFSFHFISILSSLTLYFLLISHSILLFPSLFLSLSSSNLLFASLSLFSRLKTSLQQLYLETTDDFYNDKFTVCSFLSCIVLYSPVLS